MALQLMIQRDGRPREHWYGRYESNGRKIAVNLGVKILGTPPASLSLRDEGDGMFERSRAAAQAKLDGLIEEVSSKRDSVRLVERIYEIKTGEAIKSVKLDGVADEWAKIPRRRKPNERYASQCQSTLRRFVAFVRQENGKLDEIAQVNRTLARGFMDVEAKRGVTAKTWNDTLKLLRASFMHLLPAGAINPFSALPTKDAETVFRIPFTPEELKAIVDVARDDDFIRPLLITGICTAMRRGDCCLLKWDDVDLGQRFITVKTAKTGQTVGIPIFPMLYDELESLGKKPRQIGNARTSPPAPIPAGRGEGGSDGGGKHGYVFPEQAAMYLENPDGITWRVKKVLAVALREAGADADDEALLQKLPAEETRRRGLEYIAGLPDSPKKERMSVVFEHYAGGKRLCEAVAAAGVSKGSASNYLNEIEGAIECRLIRGRDGNRGLTAIVKSNRLLGAEREGGTRRASVRDFHSFRVTWVTLALTAGVPLELVQKVTGHKTTDIVLKHYFQPGREAFRHALQSAMPKLLTNGQQSPRDEMRAMIERVTPKKLRDQLLAAWAKL